MVFGNMNVFQAGSLFPSISSSALCLTNGNEIERTEIEFLKREITRVLNQKGKINISNLSEELNFPPRKIVLALRELEEEGIIKEV